MLTLVAQVFAEPKLPQAKLGIMSAIPMEFEALQRVLKNTRSFKIPPYEVTFGELGVNRVPVVVLQTGIGKVNVASAAQFLISSLKVPALAFTGVAGGLNQNYRLADIVISKEAFEHDFGIYDQEIFIRHPAGYAPGAPDRALFPDKHSLEEWPGWNHQTNLVKYIKHVLEENVGRLATHLPSGVVTPSIHIGVSAAGDQFLNSNLEIARVRNEGADFVEMESGAIAQVAQRNNVPFLNIRSISDRGGDDSHLEFATYLEATADLSGRMLEVILNDKIIADYLKSLLGNCESIMELSALQPEKSPDASLSQR